MRIGVSEQEPVWYHSGLHPAWRTTIETLLTDWVVWLIPFISAFVGWGTNLVAVEMMFRPVEFIGLRPFLGWQGIVPAHARALAGKSTDLITEKLINLKTLFENFDADGFSGHLDAAIDEITDEIIKETAGKYAGPMWAQMAEPMKQQVRTMVRAEVKQVTVNILADLGDNIEDILDLRHIVVDAATRDKRLVGDMFQTVGAEEFKFIKRSGAYFGFLFGLIQMVFWAAYPRFWVLPFFGFFVGYATNWLAIKLIFEPAQPRRFGPIVIQGLFHKRQHAVAKQFAQMVAGEILNADNMVQKMITGASGDKLFAIVDHRIGELIEKYKKNPMVAGMVPAGEWDSIQAEILARVREELPKPGGFLHVFTTRAIDVYGELFDRMAQLDSESFEGTLRPAFQKDEWKLILAGAALGLGAGVLQVVYLFGDQLG